MVKTFDEVVLFARTGLNPRQNFRLGQGDNAYITIKNIKNNRLIIDDNTDVVDDEAIKMIHKRSQIKKGDILFATIGRMGDMYIIEEEPDGWDINESVFAFTLDTDIIRQKYFYYIFKTQSILSYLTANSSGSTFKSIKMNQLKKMTFDIPMLEEQDRVVKALDKISDIIFTQQEELKSLDNLIKSRFVEMFGDLKKNDMGWQICQFSDFAQIDTTMIRDFEEYGDYPHIGIDSIEKETGNILRYRTVREDGVISGKYLFTRDHIIYSKIRPNLNKVAVPEFNGVCSADAYPILPRKERCNRIFLAHIMRSSVFLDYILAFSSRTNLPKVNKIQVEGFQCPMPDIVLQERFADFVTQTTKLKLVG